MESTTITRRNAGTLSSNRLDRLITIDELASRLHVKKETLYQWCHRQTVPFFRLGRRTLFDPVEVDAWLELKRVDPRG